jgi:hypothetical protein
VPEEIFKTNICPAGKESCKEKYRNVSLSSLIEQAVFFSLGSVAVCILFSFSFLLTSRQFREPETVRSLKSNYAKKYVHKEVVMLSFLLTDLSFFLVYGRNDDECSRCFSSAPFTVD